MVKMSQSNKSNSGETIRQDFINFVVEQNIWDEFEAARRDTVFSEDIILEEVTYCLIF
jgi:hypothetical protein